MKDISKKIFTVLVFIFIALVLIFTVTVASAQNSQSQAQKITDKMKVDLSLTDEQVVNVLPVNQSFVEALQALKNSGGGKLAKYRKFNTADKKRDSALKKILTEEQYALFEKQKQENREALKEARKDKE